MRQHVVFHPIALTPKELSPLDFARYGTVVENPARSGSELISTAVSANQGTATKYPSITPFLNHYEHAPSQANAEAKMAMFVCKPRALTTGNLEIKVLERHPYTTQTFLPLGLSSDDKRTAFLVIVAPTLPNSQGGFDGPDVASAEAFAASGSQGVTYGVGTWHAPMIVVGEQEIDFAVLQYVNGVGQDDCEEVELVGEQGKAFVSVLCEWNKSKSKL